MNTRGVRIDHDDGHRAIGRTDGMKPHIAHAGDLRAVTPGPLALMLQITPSDLAPVWQCEDRRTFPEGVSELWICYLLTEQYPCE
jgi:hypothetical protein